MYQCIYARVCAKVHKGTPTTPRPTPTPTTAPPLITAMPLAENLSLFYSEESLEETALRKSLGLITMQEEIQQDVDAEMGDPTNPPNPLPQSTTTPSEAIPIPADPTSVASQKTNGSQLDQIKITTPKPGPIPVQETIEQPSSGVRSANIELPKLQVSKPAPQVPQAKIPDHLDQSPSIPVRSMSGPSIEVDEDDEMPAIDLESDSDME